MKVVVGETRFDRGYDFGNDNDGYLVVDVDRTKPKHRVRVFVLTSGNTFWLYESAILALTEKLS